MERPPQAPVFVISVLAPQPLIAGADISAAIRFITEVPASEQSAITLVVNCAHDGNVRYDSCRFAVSDLLSIGETGVGHYLETIYFKCSWFAFKVAPATFGIFDTFKDEDGRSAHVNGEVAKALFAHTEELLVALPDIKPVDILAEKL